MWRQGLMMITRAVAPIHLSRPASDSMLNGALAAPTASVRRRGETNYTQKLTPQGAGAGAATNPSMAPTAAASEALKLKSPCTQQSSGHRKPCNSKYCTHNLRNTMMALKRGPWILQGELTRAKGLQCPHHALEVLARQMWTPSGTKCLICACSITPSGRLTGPGAARPRFPWPLPPALGPREPEDLPAGLLLCTCSLLATHFWRKAFVVATALWIFACSSTTWSRSPRSKHCWACCCTSTRLASPDIPNSLYCSDCPAFVVLSAEGAASAQGERLWESGPRRARFPLLCDTHVGYARGT